MNVKIHGHWKSCETHTLIVDGPWLDARQLDDDAERLGAFLDEHVPIETMTRLTASLLERLVGQLTTAGVIDEKVSLADCRSAVSQVVEALRS